jgi:hypothetical protein
MTRRSIIFVVTGAVVAAGALGGGLWWHAGKDDKPVSRGKQTVGDHTISLNQPPPEDTGGLSVSQGGASDLGQLSSPGQGQDQGTSGGSGSEKVDFTKYDKYKNNKDALFGDITKGTGAALTVGKKATVTYRGWLTNGALIDQSPVSNDGKLQPFMFTMGTHEVIAGWEQGLFGMKAGGVRLIIVPPAAGYGSQGKGSVPPNAVLVFEIRLIKVQ